MGSLGRDIDRRDPWGFDSYGDPYEKLRSKPGGWRDIPYAYFTEGQKADISAGKTPRGHAPKRRKEVAQ